MFSMLLLCARAVFGPSCMLYVRSVRYKGDGVTEPSFENPTAHTIVTARKRFSSYVILYSLDSILRNRGRATVEVP